MKNDLLLARAVEVLKTRFFTKEEPYKAETAKYVYVAYRDFEASIVTQKAGPISLDLVFLGLVKEGYGSFSEIAKKLKVAEAMPVTGRANLMQLMKKHFFQLERESYLAQSRRAGEPGFELTKTGEEYLAKGKKIIEVHRKIVFSWNDLKQEIEDMRCKKGTNEDKTKFKEKADYPVLENEDTEEREAILIRARDYFNEKGIIPEEDWVDCGDSKHRERLRKTVLVSFKKDQESKAKEKLWNINDDQKNIAPKPVELEEDQSLIEKFGRKAKKTGLIPKPG